MSPSEISLLRDAVLEREDNIIYKIHLDNWLSRTVNATDSKGTKYVYKSFGDFYKPAKEEEVKIRKTKSKDKLENGDLSSYRTLEDLYRIAENLKEPIDYSDKSLLTYLESKDFEV